MFSVVLRPDRVGPEWGVLPLLTGVAVCEAIESVTGLRAALKWPNDLVIRGEDAPSGRGGKVGGILAERDASSGAIVMGVGVNVDLAEEDLPVPTATSLTLAGSSSAAPGEADRPDAVADGALVHGLGRGRNRPPALDGLLEAYRQRCLSVGAELRCSGRAPRISSAPVPGSVRAASCWSTPTAAECPCSSATSCTPRRSSVMRRIRPAAAGTGR